LTKAIIFGSNGQDGVFLTRLLESKSIEVIGVSRGASYFQGDVADYNFVNNIIRQHSPDYIFHFAANSSTRHDALFENHQAISTGTVNILESVREHCSKAKVFLSGSALQFRNDGLPIDELAEFQASSPYSFARIHSTYIGRYYRSAFGITVYCGYFFNHDSPLRSERHVNQKIVSAVKRIESGCNEKIELGNIDVQKEFNYAGDIVEAIWILVNQNDIFEVAIGCGLAYSIREWLEYCFQKINKDWKHYILINPDYPVEYKVLVSNPTQLKALGWRPKVSFYELADIMLSSS